VPSDFTLFFTLTFDSVQLLLQVLPIQINAEFGERTLDGKAKDIQKELNALADTYSEKPQANYKTAGIPNSHPPNNTGPITSQ
jgi:hypothetical protein